MYKNPLEQLQKAEEELALLNEKYNKFLKVASRHASWMIFGGFTVAASQLAAMGSLIFVIYSWDVIEPITFMVCKYKILNKY